MIMESDPLSEYYFYLSILDELNFGSAMFIREIVVLFSYHASSSLVKLIYLLNIFPSQSIYLSLSLSLLLTHSHTYTHWPRYVKVKVCRSFVHAKAESPKWMNSILICFHVSN